MDIRTTERRRQIVNKYNIKVISHLTLLNGQTIKSAAGGIVKDRYFIFELTNKTDDKKVETVFCGYKAGEDLCKLANLPIPQRFNPLSKNNSGNNRIVKNESNISKNNTNNVRWNPIRKELYNAVMLLISFFGDNNPDSFLFGIKATLEDEKFIEYPPTQKMIMSINNIIRKIRKFNSLRDIINYLHSKGNKLRKFKFDLLVNELEKKKIQQFLENY